VLALGCVEGYIRAKEIGKRLESGQWPEGTFGVVFWGERVACSCLLGADYDGALTFKVRLSRGEAAAV
jgi:hypothetical protein